MRDITDRRLIYNEIAATADTLRLAAHHVRTESRDAVERARTLRLHAERLRDRVHAAHHQSLGPAS